MKSADEILLRARMAGAIENINGNAAVALRHLAERDPAAAEQFASKARTPMERAEVILAYMSPGTSLAAARRMAIAFGAKDPDAYLTAVYGD